jgi:hypothetical protein
MTAPPLDPDQLARLVAERDLELSRFTAEELDATSASDGPLLEPAGWYAGLDETARDTARIAALRSLVARGFLLQTPPPPSDDTGPGYEPAGDLASVLRLRALAQGVVRIEHHAPAGEVRRHAWLLRPGLLLDERGNRDGYHAFVLRTERSLAVDVMTRLDPEGVAERVAVSEAPSSPSETDEAGDEHDRFTDLSELAAEATSWVRVLSSWGGDPPRVLTTQLALTPAGLVGLAIDVDEDGRPAPAAALLAADDALHTVLACLLPPVTEEPS